MLSSPAEVARRARGRLTGRLHSLPILALHVHTACNCRCVMCDIWKANAAKREIGADELTPHMEAIRALRVRRVMLTGGEPLLHSNLWALCDLLRAEGIQISLVTTGLLLDAYAEPIIRTIDEVVVSIDGPPSVHDRIRRVPGGFAKVRRGIDALKRRASAPRIVVRSVVQKANHAVLCETIQEVAATGADVLSFLAADVFSPAFNRPSPWDETRRGEIALDSDDLPILATTIARAEQECGDRFASGFVVGGSRSLWRLHDYYRALAGAGALPRVRCRAPWVSAVLEADGTLRPCFFHNAYPRAERLDDALNSPEAIRFRRTLDVARNETCRRCVCSLALPFTREP
ncbi:MAG: radical SAM protein [Acidobacteria bacterium]|nr:radical SAM protein [Acidobacteriota bacterium]